MWSFMLRRYFELRSFDESLYDYKTHCSMRFVLRCAVMVNSDDFGDSTYAGSSKRVKIIRCVPADLSYSSLQPIVTIISNFPVYYF